MATGTDAAQRSRRQKKALLDPPVREVKDHGDGTKTDYGWLNDYIKQIQERMKLKPTYYEVAREWDAMDRAMRAQSGLNPPDRASVPSSRISKIWKGKARPERETLDVLAALAHKAGLIDDDPYEWRRRGGREPWERPSADKETPVTRLALHASGTVRAMIEAEEPTQEHVQLAVDLFQRVIKASRTGMLPGSLPIDLPALGADAGNEPGETTPRTARRRATGSTR